jgi:hypothetical protein
MTIRQLRYWLPYSEAPVLYQPDFSRKFFLQTDISAYSIGAVLSQEHSDNMTKPQRHILLLLLPPLGKGFEITCLSFTSIMQHLSLDPSMFDIYNLFHHHWFLSQDWLISHITAAQCTNGCNIDLVKFNSKSHIHLVHLAFKLIPPTPCIPTVKVKQVMFTFILSILNKNLPPGEFFMASPAPCV